MAEKEVKKTKPVKAEQAEKPKSTAGLLLENFVSLQRIMADLAIKTSRLNNQISKLLELFEEAAKDFKEKEKPESSDELTSKIDRLIEQNKTIARGLSLIGQTSKTREVSAESSKETGEEETEKAKAKPLPEFRF